MDKQTKNGLMYAAGVVAAYLGYTFYKKQQGKAQQPPPTTPTAPTSPTFQGASQAYIKNVKILQTLLGVTADGIIGPITQGAAAKYGIKYSINASNVIKAIATVTLAKSKPAFDFSLR